MSVFFPQLTPVVLIDTREQAPLKITAYPVERVGLRTADYSIKGFEHRIVFERKSLSDLIGSLTTGRKRFFAEIDRMRHVETPVLLIEGTREMVEAHTYRSRATPASILGSLDAITIRTPVKIHWAGDSTGAAAWLENAVRLFVRGVEKDYKALLSATIPAKVEGVEQEHVAAVEGVGGAR